MIKLFSCVLLGLLLLSSMALAQEVTPEVSTPGVATYVVVRGDTLGNIAFRYHTTTNAILRANNLTDPDLIIAGTVLIIPVNSALTPTAPPTAIPPTPPPLTPIPSIGFDLGGEIFGFAHLDAMTEAGMHWAKLRLDWTPGDDTVSATRMITQLHDAGFKVLLEISGTATDANLALYYVNFVTYLGEVAALAPDAIEVWGGMNDDHTWSHGLTDATAYANLLKNAFTAIKRANSSVLVVSGALTQGDGNRNYLEAMADAGVGLYADCIGMGYTLGALPPDASRGDTRGNEFVYYYPTLVATHAEFFPNKPLCFTEVGYLVTDNPPLESGYDWAGDTTHELRAEWLAQAAQYAAQLGRVRLFVVYNMDAAAGAENDLQANYAIIEAANLCLACDALSAVVSSAG